jgi:hypothetical protein
VPEAISEHAAAFAPLAFKSNLVEQVRIALQERSYAPQRLNLEGGMPEIAAAA